MIDCLKNFDNFKIEIKKYSIHSLFDLNINI